MGCRQRVWLSVLVLGVSLGLASPASSRGPVYTAHEELGLGLSSLGLRATAMSEWAHPRLAPDPLFSGFALSREPVELGACKLYEIDELELAESLREGYMQVFGKAPTMARLACAWAHCALEHARGSHVLANNLGNITTSGAWPGQTCTVTTTSRVGYDPDRWKVSVQHYRAHKTLVEGAVDYWKTMTAHYRRVLWACDSADAQRAAKGFHQLGYYTAESALYAESLPRLYFEAIGNVLPFINDPPPPLLKKPRHLRNVWIPPEERAKLPSQSLR